MQKNILNSLVVATLIALTGCANNSANMRVGTEQTNFSLRDQREAALSVKEYISKPDGADLLGRVDAARCHRNTLQAPPSEDDIKLDLKLAAYAKGADGIAEVKVSKSSGLLQNCWYIFNAEAIAFRIGKQAN